MQGVVLLAAYPGNKLDPSTALLAVYGTEDKVLNLEAYQKAKADFPPNARERVIEGGNHAQFGNYGAQSGDGTPAISRKEQQMQTVREILAFCELFSEGEL